VSVCLYLCLYVSRVGECGCLSVCLFVCVCVCLCQGSVSVVVDECSFYMDNHYTFPVVIDNIHRGWTSNIVLTVSGPIKVSSLIHSLYCYYLYYRFMALCLALPGWAGTERNIHSLMVLSHWPHVDEQVQQLVSSVNVSIEKHGHILGHKFSNMANTSSATTSATCCWTCWATCG